MLLELSPSRYVSITKGCADSLSYVNVKVVNSELKRSLVGIIIKYFADTSRLSS